MADTIRDRPALLALLADNTTGNISPQDMRDMLVSTHGVLGAIYVNDGAVAQTGIGTSPVKVTGFAADGPGAAGTSPDHTSDRIVVDVTGTYEASFQISFTGSSSTEFTFTGYIDGAPTFGKAVRKIGTGGDVGSTAMRFGGPVTAGQAVEVWVSADGAGSSITPIHMGLDVHKLS